MPANAPWLSAPAHARWLESEADRLLEFSRRSRHPQGGFAWLDVAGQPELDRAVELWITCRMTHVFALGHLMGRPGCGPLVDHGVAALAGRFRDPVNGGWYAGLAREGPTARDKTAYEHAFVLLAASSATCAGRPGGRASRHRTDRGAREVLGRGARDGGRAVGRDVLLARRLSRRQREHARRRGVPRRSRRARGPDPAHEGAPDRHPRRARLGPVHHWRLPEHFDASWTPRLEYNADTPAHPFRPYGATIGHWLEWARLTLHLREALGSSAPDWMLQDARSLFDAAVHQGWAVDGADGFVYTVDWEGRPVVRERMHWVAAEATAAAAALHAATGEASYDGWYRTWWDHIATVFIDEQLGSWHHELDPHNRPGTVTWDGKPDVYHAVQATLIPRLPLAPSLATALRDGNLA